MRPLLAAYILLLPGCVHEDLKTRHGSPLHTYKCEGGKTFQARQIISGEVEVTAGGKTRDVTNANGDPLPDGPRMTDAGSGTRLIGMPGGPYEGCALAEDPE